MPKEFEYSITRVCLRRGELSLPPSMIDVFEASGNEILDTVSDELISVSFRAERTLTGLSAFFEQHDLQVNDAILIRKAQDGRVSFTPRARKRVRVRSSEETRLWVQHELLAAEPVTEAEARALLPDLPADFDLAALLQEDDTFTFSAGRWRAAVQDDAAPQPAETMRRPAATSSRTAPETTIVPENDRVAWSVSVLEQLGFSVRQVQSGLLLDARVANGGFRVLGHVVEPDGKVDWNALLKQRELDGADCLTLIGEDQDLVRLSGAASLAPASLLSFAGLARAADYAESVPLSPLDLESHLRTDGLFEAGLERFEELISDRISERGAFSLILYRLAALPGPGAFRIEDILDPDVSRQHADAVLDQLAHAPFQLVAVTAPGHYYLRSSISSALQQFAEYAGSLLERLPADASGRQAEHERQTVT